MKAWCKDRSHKRRHVQPEWLMLGVKRQYIPVDLQPNRNVHNVGLVVFQTPYTSPCASEWASRFLTMGIRDQTEISNPHREAIVLAEDRRHALPTVNGFWRADEVFISSQCQDRCLRLSQMILVREGSIPVAQPAFPKSGCKLQYNLCRHCACKSYNDINFNEHTQPCRPRPEPQRCITF